MKKLSLKIHGLVQGVFFRKSVQNAALRLGLEGTVRNKDDGTVELVAEGKREDLQKLLDWCREGSKAARVEKIDIRWSDELQGMSGFRIIE